MILLLGGSARIKRRTERSLVGSAECRKREGSLVVSEQVAFCGCAQHDVSKHLISL